MIQTNTTDNGGFISVISKDCFLISPERSSIHPTCPESITPMEVPMKTWSLSSLLLVPVLVLAICLPAGASTMYSGHLFSTLGELVSDWKTPNGSPSSTTLSWTVSFDDQIQLWEYAYTFTGTKPDISHAILEVSSSFSGDPIDQGGNLGPGSSSCAGCSPTTYNAHDQGQSNYGIPGDIYGLKFENQSSWTIVTDKSPMWGDFYAKGAQTGYAYNSGFGMNTSAAIGNGNAGQGDHAWVLVPDTNTQVTPIPAGIWLLGAGCIGLFGVKRFRR